MSDTTDPNLSQVNLEVDDTAPTDSLSQRISAMDKDISAEVDSIDEDSDFSDYSTTSSTDTRDIQREWDENMEQGRQLFAIVIFPFVGRWLGKKMSYWVWTRFLQNHYKFRSIAA